MCVIFKWGFWGMIFLIWEGWNGAEPLTPEWVCLEIILDPLLTPGYQGFVMCVAVQHPTYAESSSHVQSHYFLLNQNPACKSSIFISVFSFSFPSKHFKSNKKRQKTLPVFSPITGEILGSQIRHFFPSIFPFYSLILFSLLDKTPKPKIYPKLWFPKIFPIAFIFWGK